MADELDPVTQQFIADLSEYVADVQEAADDARSFADANIEAKAAVDDMRDHVDEAAPSLGHMRDEAIETGEALGHVRDEALEAALAVKKLKDEDDSEAGKGFLASLFGEGGRYNDALSGIPLLGTLIETPELLAAIVPAVMAVVTEVGALATGLTAAGLGVGAFAALAYPAFKQVFGAVGDTKSQLDKLPGPVQTAVEGIQQLEGEFGKMSKAFGPTALTALDEGLKIANQLLPYVGQFASAAAPAVEGLLGSISKAVGSPQFKSFMDFLESLSGPVITAVGSGLSGLGRDIAILMEQFSKKDVVNSINIAFRLMGFALTVLTGIIVGSMDAWDWITQTALPDASKAFDTTRHAVATAGHDIAHTFDDVRHDIAQWADDAVRDFDDVRHKVASIGDDIARPFVLAYDWVKSNWQDILVWLLVPVLAAVYEIRTHTHEIAEEFDKMRHMVAAILDGLVHDQETAFDNARHDIAAFADWVPKEIERRFDEARHLAAAAADGMVRDVETRWDEFRHDAAAVLDDVVGSFRRLPGELAGALAALPGMLYAAGAQAIRSLISGAGSMIGSGISDLEGWGHDLANAVVNPFGMHLSEPSEAAIMIKAGINATRGLAAGMLSEVGAVRQASAAISAAAGMSGGGSYGALALGGGGYGAAGGGTSLRPLNVTVPITISSGGTMDAHTMQTLQSYVQEAVARWSLNNPGTGFGLPGRA